MGKLDGTVAKILDTIARSHQARKDDAESLAASAEKKFSNVSTLVRELKPALVEKFPDLEPDVQIGNWTRSGVDAVNTIRLKRKGKGREQSINLRMNSGRPEVDIDGRRVPQQEILNTISAAIARFFAKE